MRKMLMASVAMLGLMGSANADITVRDMETLKASAIITGQVASLLKHKKCNRDDLILKLRLALLDASEGIGANEIDLRILNINFDMGLKEGMPGVDKNCQFIIKMIEDIIIKLPDRMPVKK